MHLKKLLVLGMISCVLVTNGVPTVVKAEEIDNGLVYESGTQVNDCLDFLKLNSNADELQEINKEVQDDGIEIPDNIGTPKVDEYCSIREKASETSDSIAKLYKFGIVEIVDDGTYDAFYKVRIGEIIGYINKDYLYTGKKAKSYIKGNIAEYKKGISLKEGIFAIAGYKTKKQAGKEAEILHGKVSIDDDVTVYKTKSDSDTIKDKYKTVKVAVIKPNDGTYLYKKADDSSTRLEIVTKDDNIKVLKKSSDYIKVESKGIRGYIKSSKVKFKNKKLSISNIETKITDKSKIKLVKEGNTWCKIKVGKSNEGFVKRDKVSIIHTADKKSKSVDVINYGETINVEKESNKYVKTKAGYFNKNFLTMSVVQDLSKLEILEKDKDELDKNINYNVGGVAEGKAKDVIEFALKYLGNPYVWGGDSLTNGVDCSGYVREIYKHFGYSLPRVSYDQANTYTKVDIEDVKPADLVFYHNGERISHVALYIGDNKVIHASNRKDGIKISEWTYRKPYKVVRILEEERNSEKDEGSKQN